jgi:hypothetical protein
VSVGVVKSKQVETVAIFLRHKKQWDWWKILQSQSCLLSNVNTTENEEDGGKHLQSVDLAHIMFNANLFRLGRDIF